jgi:hypothetical protein
VKKQGKVKLLKMNGLSASGPVVRGKKMLKMQDDPAMCMKTNGLVTECPSRNRTFLIKMGAVLTSLWSAFEPSGAII